MRARWVGHVARMREMRYGYKILVGKAENKRPPGRLWHVHDVKIKMDRRSE